MYFIIGKGSRVWQIVYCGRMYFSRMHLGRISLCSNYRVFIKSLPGLKQMITDETPDMLKNVINQMSESLYMAF
jgi:hypothetical protein